MMMMIAMMMMMMMMIVTSIIKILQTVGFMRKAVEEISRQYVKPKHSKMQEKHLIKIATLLWRVITKIMKQSISTEQASYQKGRQFFFGYITQN